MDEKGGVISCAITVAGGVPKDHVGDYIAGGAIVAAILIVAVAVVMAMWISHRQSTEYDELRRLREIVKGQEARGSI